MRSVRLSNTFLHRRHIRLRRWGAEGRALDSSLLVCHQRAPVMRRSVFSDHRSSHKRGQVSKVARSGGNRQSPDLAAITEISQELSKLQEQFPRASVSHSPSLWESQEDPLVPNRDELLNQASLIIQLLKRRIKTGVIRPDRKYRREVSIIEERLLNHLLSCVMDGRKDVYPMVCEILNLMQQFQMEILLTHCEPAMYIAAREGHYPEAAKLFQMQLDVGSMEIPDDPTLGLFCIAKHCKDSGALPVESVFEAVAKLVVKSTDGGEKHVLAAGVALGRIGEWEATRDYLKTSYIANQFGQPLVAAAMEACVLSEQPDMAMNLFNELEAGELAAAVEWQWSGDSKKIHAACRDVAIRAMGDLVDPAIEAERMVTLYQEAETEGVALSIEANRSVLKALGRIGKVEESVAFFTSLLDNGPKYWMNSSKNLFITSERTDLPISREAMLSLLLDIMESCNHLKRFGLALFTLKLFQLSLPNFEQREHSSDIEWSPTLRSLLQSKLDFEGSNRLLAATMTSLCGVHAPHEAVALYDLLTSKPADENANKCFRIQKYAKSMLQVIDPTLVHSWSYVQRHIDRLVAAFIYLEKSQEAVQPEDLKILANALATAVVDCTAASTPETGLALGAWIDNRKLNIIQMGDDHPILFSEDDKNSIFPVSDPLLSAVIGAYQAHGKTETADRLVNNFLFGSRSPVDWLLSYEKAVEILFSKGESKNATAMFRKILAFSKSPDFFAVAARGLVHSGDWRGVVEVYKLALSSGCSCEDLSLLAMESVSASGRLGHKEGQLPFLRSIILEASKQTGVTPKAWVEMNYWKLRRLLGFSTARLIMGWDDARTSRLDELELALENLEERRSAGLTPKHSVLFAIVKAVANYDTIEVPFNRTGLPRIPRNREAWVSVLEKVLKEADTTMIVNEPRFIDGAAMAAYRLGLYQKCLTIVSDAIERGIRVNVAAMKNADDSAAALNNPGTLLLRCQHDLGT